MNCAPYAHKGELLKWTAKGRDEAIDSANYNPKERDDSRLSSFSVGWDGNQIQMDYIGIVDVRRAAGYEEKKKVIEGCNVVISILGIRWGNLNTGWMKFDRRLATDKC